MNQSLAKRSYEIDFAITNQINKINKIKKLLVLIRFPKIKNFANVIRFSSDKHNQQ